MLSSLFFFTTLSNMFQGSTSFETRFCDAVDANDPHKLSAFLSSAKETKLTDNMVFHWLYSDKISFSMVLTRFPKIANYRLYHDNVPAWFELDRLVYQRDAKMPDEFIWKFRMLALADCDLDATARCSHAPTGTPARMTLAQMLKNSASDEQRPMNRQLVKDFVDLVELSRASRRGKAKKTQRH